VPDQDPDHGVAALGVLAGFYRDGSLNPRPRVRVLHETDGAIHLDGDRGAGPGAPTRAMGWCIDRARQRAGMAVAAVRGWQLLVAPHKGFGLALFIDALSGVLTGAGFARGVVPLAPASWQLLTTGCESLGVPLPAVLDH
jgi:LDH2 family malate/lactate/ureidoglycolate dehydrogenase